MKRFILLFWFILLQFAAAAQHAGNVNFQKNFRRSPQQNSLALPSDDDVIISVKGLMNVTPEMYVAIVNVSQAGKTAEEADKLLTERIEKVKQAIGENADVSFVVDMISFVPMYEFEKEKKVFSRSYNEVPVGFELNKNLHVKFSKLSFLDEFLSACAVAEIYDLVKVDYVSLTLTQKKKELKDSAKKVLSEKVAFAKEVLASDFAGLRRDIADAFDVFYPVEMYKSYQAFGHTNQISQQKARLNASNKKRTQFYQPLVDKEFDFVINPEVVAPVIQLVYELKLRIVRTKEKERVIQKEFYTISPTGEMRKLPIKP